MNIKLNIETAKDSVLVAIDIAKARNDILIQLPDGSKKAFKVANDI